MFRSAVLRWYEPDERLLHPWLFVLLADFLVVHHMFLERMTYWYGNPPPRRSTTLFLLLGLACVCLAWACLRQFRLVRTASGTGLILASFGVGVTAWIDMLGWMFVETPPHYLSWEQFGVPQAQLCRGAAHLAYAIGLGLVVGACVADVRTGRRQGP